MDTITLYALCAYTNGHLLPFTIDIEDLSYEEYQAEVERHLERLKDECIKGEHGEELRDYTREGYLPFEEIIVAEYEGIPDQYVWEYGIQADYFELKDLDVDVDIIRAYIECFGIQSIDSIEATYVGYYESEYEFIQETYKKDGYLTGNNPLATVIDWDLAALEVMQHYCESSGYYFRYA